MYNAARVKANRAYYLGQGNCPRCGGQNPVEPGFNRCRQCAIKESEQRRRRREELKRMGLCPTCGGPRDDEAFRTCSKCRQRSHIYYAGKPEKTTDQNTTEENEMSTTAKSIITQQEIAEATGMPQAYISEALYSVKSVSKEGRTRQYDTKEALKAVLGFSEHRRQAVEEAAARKVAKWDSYIKKVEGLLEV